MQNISFWAREQLKLRKIFEQWVAEEIDKYEENGFKRIFGDKDGHALDEVGGYTRSFVGDYCLSGNERIVNFLKTFRDDWHKALNKSGHFYHGYDANEEGDYVKHTAEAFTQFLLNVLYLDITDEKTITMVEDAAEHLGNWSSDVQNWYDWGQHKFLSYFLGTKSPYHKPPYNWQSFIHFRVLQIAIAAYEVTGNERYLDLCIDYCNYWADYILTAEETGDISTGINIISKKEYEYYVNKEKYQNDWHFSYYYGTYGQGLQGNEEYSQYMGQIKNIKPPYHGFHDPVMTWLEIYKYVSEEKFGRVLKRLMKAWIEAGKDLPSQVAGLEPHCGLHLPKYRDFTGDTTLDNEYLKQWPDGSCSYLLTGEVDRLLGSASGAAAVFRQTLLRNRGVYGEKFATDHACSVISIPGNTSAFIAPSLFMPAFGGLNVHYGRAPWVKMLYYNNGKIGLPDKVAAIYVPAGDSNKEGVRIANGDKVTHKIAIRKVDPLKSGKLVLTAPPQKDLPEVEVKPGEEIFKELSVKIDR